MFLALTPMQKVSAATDIRKAQIGGFSYEVTYEGKPVKFPNLTVRVGDVLLEKKVDYKVKYKRNKQPGSAVMKIKGKGDYTGVIEIEFDII